MRRTPLRAKRPTPRRAEGRVQHERMKPRTVEPAAEQRAYWNWLRETRGECEACSRRRALVVHHLLARVAGKAGRRDHWYVVLICPNCHAGTEGVHGLGSEAKFLERHGVDLVAVSIARLEEYRNGKT